MNQSHSTTYLQYAVQPSLPYWGDLEGWVAYTYCKNNPINKVDPTGMLDDGYESANGNYQWFDKHTEKSFTDKDNITWTKVTDNKKQWNEAMTIRNSIIVSLEKLGHNKADVMKDVKLFSGRSSLFTKESKLNNPEKYTSTWTPEFNSETKKEDAFTSPELVNSGYALKFYPKKGGIENANAIRVVKTGRTGHFFEAGIEKIERRLWGSSADNDPLYDMHYQNAKDLYKTIKK